MKKLLFLIVCSVFLIGCDEGIKPTVSLLSGMNANLEQETLEYNTKVGAVLDNGVEAGIAGAWSDDVEQDWNTVGVYVQQRLLEDPNSILIGEVSLGAQATIDYSAGDNGMYGFYISKITNVGGIDINTEIQYRHYQDALAGLSDNQGNGQYKILIGPKFKF